MISYKLIPQFRENCVIKGKKEWLINYSVGDTIFLISNKPTKKYSTISMIDEIEYGNEPLIYIDKRNLGNFSENDDVSLLKYNPAEALSVEINISNEYIIPKGEWAANIKPFHGKKALQL
jgi:hypothetical protein